MLISTESSIIMAKAWAQVYTFFCGTDCFGEFDEWPWPYFYGRYVFTRWTDSGQEIRDAMRHSWWSYILMTYTLAIKYRHLLPQQVFHILLRFLRIHFLVFLCIISVTLLHKIIYHLCSFSYPTLQKSSLESTYSRRNDFCFAFVHPYSFVCSELHRYHRHPFV